jgi:hypothetical protein
MAQIDQAGHYSVYKMDDSRGFYFEHDAYGEERAVAVHVLDGVAHDFEGMGTIPQVVLNWLRLEGVNVDEVK